MRCPNCNSPVEKGAVFCEVCGSSLTGKKRSKLPVVIISLVLMLAVAGGITVWVVSGEYHEKGEVSREDIPTADEGAQQDAGEGSEEAAGTEKGDSLDGTQDGLQADSQSAGAAAQPEEQEPVYDPTEGGIHRYEYVVSDCTWTEAYQRCLDAGGYLVRINSLEEYDYILSEIESQQLQNIQFRIGGRRDADSQDYYWVDEANQLYGEKINSGTYWNNGQWMAGEPSFSDGSTQETCLDIFYYGSEGRWVWNDVPDDILSVASEFSGKIGYICEYEN